MPIAIDTKERTITGLCASLPASVNEENGDPGPNNPGVPSTPSINSMPRVEPISENSFSYMGILSVFASTSISIPDVAPLNESLKESNESIVSVGESIESIIMDWLNEVFGIGGEWVASIIIWLNWIESSVSVGDRTVWWGSSIDTGSNDSGDIKPVVLVPLVVVFASNWSRSVMYPQAFWSTTTSIGSHPFMPVAGWTAHTLGVAGTWSMDDVDGERGTERGRESVPKMSSSAPCWTASSSGSFDEEWNFSACAFIVYGSGV